MLAGALSWGSKPLASRDTQTWSPRPRCESLDPPRPPRTARTQRPRIAAAACRVSAAGRPEELGHFDVEPGSHGSAVYPVAQSDIQHTQAKWRNHDS